jgi:quercetin dioxygenase-like cupin family protein
MIRRAEELQPVLQPQMKGGTGTTEVIRGLQSGEYESGLKLIGRLVLRPGCSLGYHVHQGEEEIIHILQGEANYNDDGAEFTLHAGDTCLCRSGHGHSIACAGDGELVLYAVINQL